MYSNSHHDELEPRPVPRPTQFQEISAKPEVPELSVVFESSESNYSKSSNRKPSNVPYVTKQLTQETYSEWKNRQNQSPIYKENLNYELHNKNYGSLDYGDYNPNPYSRFSEKINYKSDTDHHKCTCQNTPTIKDIYSMMQIQNDQMKFLLETIQKLLVTVLSNQQNQHKCCCFENSNCVRDKNPKKTELLKNNTQEECKLQYSNDEQIKVPQTNFNKKDESVKIPKSVYKPDILPVVKNNPKTRVTKCNGNNDKKNNNKDKERTYSIASDDSFELNANDVQITEAPISPEPSIHIEMQSSDDSSNSEVEENNKKIEVGWTMYKNIIGQVNNLLEDDKSECKSETIKPVQCANSTSTKKPKNFEPYTHFVLPENNKIDSSLQMQALAMQYLSPDQAIKFDMNKHFVPTTQTAVQSPNNYSISTLHYMERYHLIAPEKNYNSDNLQHNVSTDGTLKKKKKNHHVKIKHPLKSLTSLNSNNNQNYHNYLL